MSDGRSFPSACRAFLADLADSVERSEAPPHARECAACRARWRAARAQAALLRSLPRPEIPGSTSPAEELEGILVRVSAGSEARLGRLLRQALHERRAPADATWQEAPEPAGLAEWLRALLPARRAPGWLWARVLAEVRSPAGRRRRPAVGRLAAAAVLAVAGTLALRSWLAEPQKDGTPSVPGLVWLDESEPLDSSLVPVDTLRELGR